MARPQPALRGVTRPQPQRDDLERNDWMEEDEPAVGVPVQSSAAPFGQPTAPAMPWGLSNSDLTSSRMGGRVEGSLPLGSGGLMRPPHPSGVRNIPIVWPDDDDGPTYHHPVGLTNNPRIEEIPSSAETEPVLPSHHQQHAMVDDEIPSTASSAFRAGGEAVGPQRFGGPTYPVEEDLDPDFNPNAPRIAEVPVMPRDEGIDIEEEMLRAAIEASRREAAEATRRGSVVDLSEVVMTSFGCSCVGGGCLWDASGSSAACHVAEINVICSVDVNMFSKSQCFIYIHMYVHFDRTVYACP